MEGTRQKKTKIEVVNVFKERRVFKSCMAKSETTYNQRETSEEISTESAMDVQTEELVVEAAISGIESLRTVLLQQRSTFVLKTGLVVQSACKQQL